jgi:acyl carrier protein
MTSGPPIYEQIRVVIAEHGRLAGEIATMGEDDDLFTAGMTSHASVTVMLALEDSFDLEFPDQMLNRVVFSSIRSIADAIGALKDGGS